MNIIKRNGEFEEYSPLKIKQALEKAFKACGYKIPEEILDEMVQEVDIWEDIEVEDIQDQIEEILWDYDYPTVAKTYILYRSKRETLRNQIKEDIDFIEDFAMNILLAGDVDYDKYTCFEDICLEIEALRVPSSQIVNSVLGNYWNVFSLYWEENTTEENYVMITESIIKFLEDYSILNHRIEINF